MDTNNILYETKEKKQRKTLGFKIIMFVLTISYLSLFIYEYINIGFPINNENIIKIILLFLAVLLCCISAITNSLATYLFSIANYILIFSLVMLSINNYLPSKTKDKTVKKELEEKNIICTGATDISSDTNIELTYINNDIEKLIYIYKFSIDQKDGAQNLINRFDKQYVEYDTIYSEITISDNIIVKLTYDIKNIDSNKKKELDSSITSYKTLKKDVLDKMTCKSREY